MTYRWAPSINTPEHQGHRASFVRGADSWQYATDPTVPWYEQYDANSLTEIEVRNTGQEGVLGYALIALPDGDFHIPYLIESWIKHDVEELLCDGSPCSWYTGTNTSVAATKFDEWSVWTNELGHAQNITHQMVDLHSSPVEGGHYHTMRSDTFNGNTDKSNSTHGIKKHERIHACKPYELSHNDIVCGSLN